MKSSFLRAAWYAMKYVRRAWRVVTDRGVQGAIRDAWPKVRAVFKAIIAAWRRPDDAHLQAA